MEPTKITNYTHSSVTVINSTTEDVLDISSVNQNNIIHGQSLQEISFQIKRLVLPILCLIGLTGSILLILILSKQKNRGNTTSLLLLSLALSDIFVLLTGNLSEWLMVIWTFDVRSVNVCVCVNFMSS